MSFDPTLPLPSTLQMHAGSQVLLTTRNMATAGMPLKIEQAVNMEVSLIHPSSPTDVPVRDLEIGGFPIVGLRLEAGQVGPGHVDISWTRSWEAPGNGFRRRIQVQVHAVGTDLPILTHQVADQISVAPLPSKQEVSLFLDRVDGRRPYGARKVATAQSVLDQIGRGLAMHQALACTRDVPAPVLSTLVSDHALLLLMGMGFDRFGLPRSLEAFIRSRLQA